MSQINYKIGDKVKIKSIDWYNENKIDLGYVCLDKHSFTPSMSKYCGQEMTVMSVDKFNNYHLVEDDGWWKWTNEMFE